MRTFSVGYPRQSTDVWGLGKNLECSAVVETRMAAQFNCLEPRQLLDRKNRTGEKRRAHGTRKQLEALRVPWLKLSPYLSSQSNLLWLDSPTRLDRLQLRQKAVQIGEQSANLEVYGIQGHQLTQYRTAILPHDPIRTRTTPVSCQRAWQDCLVSSCAPPFEPTPPCQTPAPSSASSAPPAA